MQELLDLLATVLPRVANIALFIAFGVALANLLVGFGAVRAIARLSRPLTRPANLPEEVGTAILTTTASTTAGYGMLAEFRESGALDDRATLVAVTINTFFGFAQHVFTFYAPVLIPILGLEVGLLYVGTRAAVALAITATGVLAGALLLDGDNVDRAATPAVEADGGRAAEGQSAGAVVRDAVESGLAKTRDILPRLLVIYTAVAFLTSRYDVARVAGAGAADPLAGTVGLPAAAVPVVAVFTLDTTNGALVLSPLVEEGVFTPRTAVATMLVGGIVSFTVSTFKRSIPFQYGIWGADFGSKVIVVNTALKVAWIAVALVVLLYVPF
ncbi:nucleoside recognition domain-containing protein [Halomarina ordinaria]|uniref:Nucleoside recognition domain-containing protein n=1 Tax=Halomarina ordinaria TaxID=3033939 RepID=A0ABD5UD07_9EURY|nr:nucleoside recognition domain-containing protein [Halomarina sp. PSRA2]